MQEMAGEGIRNTVIIATAIFLIAPAFIVVYIFIYNQRKKLHIQEKAQMKLSFEAEIAKTQLEVQEQTMQTIGAELHDNIGQLLSLTSLTLNSIELDNAALHKGNAAAGAPAAGRSVGSCRTRGSGHSVDQLDGTDRPV